MILATIKLKGREDKRREILQTISGIADQVRQVEGCLNVKSYQDIDDQDTFFHVEEWQTPQALESYLNSKLFAALLGIDIILREKPVLEFMATDHISYSEKNPTHPFKIRLKEQNGVK